MVDTESNPEEAPSEADESQPLGSRVPFMSEEFEASEPSSTRTISSQSPVSSDSTEPLPPDHPLTHVSPTPTPTQVLFHRKIARMAGLDDEGQGLEDEGPGIKETEEAVTEGQQQAVSVVDTTTSEPLGLGYEAARRRVLESIDEISPSTYEVGQSSRSVPERAGAKRISAFRHPTLVTWLDPEDGRVYIDIPTYAPPVVPVQTPLSLERSSGSLPISPSSPVVPSLITSPVATPTATISDHTRRLDALPHILFADIERDVRELYTRSGTVRDKIFLQGYRLRSLERQNDAQRTALWHAIYDTKRENHDLRMQLAEERRERSELANRVARMERRHESREE
nr:hypothetical protein [Tanacetum cinerariifolium]